MPSTQRRNLVAALSLAAALLAAAPATAQTSWSTSRQIHIGGEGAWDYVTADPATHRLFITRSTHTQVLDTATGKVLGDIPGQKRSHGVAIVPAVNRGFITDGGGSGAIVIFNLKTYAILGSLTAMPDADGIIYDVASKKVIFVSGDGNLLTTLSPDVDPVHGKIDPPIALGGAPEFLAADGAGKVFVNLMDKSLLAAVDLKDRKVLAKWPVAPGGSPVGLAIDPAHHHLFIGCRKPAMLVEMSTEDGKVLGAVPIGTGVDATGYLNGEAFASTGDGNLTVATETGGKLTVLQTVKTAPGARTLGIDPSAKKIYLPTSEFEPSTGPGRPKQKPDTFMILEVTHK